jgi:hypothetical protein
MFERHRRSSAALLLTAAVVAAALAAALPTVNAQSTQQEASLSSIPQGVARLTRVDDALDQLLLPLQRLQLPWSNVLTELLRKHLNQNLEVGSIRCTFICIRYKGDIWVTYGMRLALGVVWCAAAGVACVASGVTLEKTV